MCTHPFEKYIALFVPNTSSSYTQSGIPLYTCSKKRNMSFINPFHLSSRVCSMGTIPFIQMSIKYLGCLMWLNEFHFRASPLNLTSSFLYHSQKHIQHRLTWASNLHIEYTHCLHQHHPEQSLAFHLFCFKNRKYSKIIAEYFSQYIYVSQEWRGQLYIFTCLILYRWP